MEKALTRHIRRPSWMTPFGSEGWGDLFFDRLRPEWLRDMGEEWSPAVNFYEKEGNYHLTADLPGVKKEDISLTIDGGYLTLNGKKEFSKEEEDGNYYMKETRCGSFSRSFKLPGKVHEDRVDAAYKDGVLTVVLPKKEDSNIKKIPVH
ncbi:MAG: Hsp20/alpha crystallin family protein [Deltaproteobacteria bacterium]|nr:Hsp20/alpha crystallin family protein [Deltaproteobacteria bacterium]